MQALLTLLVIMGWKMYLFVIFTNVTLINSGQDELGTTPAFYPWTGMASRTASPLITDESNAVNTKDHQPMATEDSVQRIQEHGPLLTKGFSIDDHHPFTTDEIIQKLQDRESLTTDEKMTSWGSALMVSSSTLATWADITAEDSIDSATTTIKSEIKQGTKQCSIYNMIIVVVLPGILSVSGFIGNTLTVMVFWPDRHESASSVLLLQLAITDSLVLVIWYLLSLYRILRHSGLIRSPALAIFGLPIAILIQMIERWLIVNITIQRYVAVCHPHKMYLVNSVRAAWIQLTVLILFCVFFTLPRFVEAIIRAEGDGPRGTIFDDPTYEFYYEGIAYYIVNFVVPLILLVFFTVSIIHQLRKSKMKTGPVQQLASSGTAFEEASASDNPRTQAAQSKTTKKENSITLSLVVVDIVFLLCQPINLIGKFADYLLPAEQNVCGTPYSYVEPFSATGIFINSSVNFLIFCICSKGFRKKVFQQLCGKTRGVRAMNSLTSQQPNTMRTTVSD